MHIGTKSICSLFTKILQLLLRYLIFPLSAHLKAYASLQSFEQRKAYSDTIKESLIASGTKKTSAFIHVVPKANYYVRWPSYYEDQHMEIEPLHSA